MLWLSFLSLTLSLAVLQGFSGMNGTMDFHHRFKKSLMGSTSTVCVAVCVCVARIRVLSTHTRLWLWL